MIPSASDLMYFLEVAHTLNLSRASERLGISQPSLTLAIQRLEYIVGTNILIRNKRGVVLTQAGKQLFLHARQLLQTWDQVKTQALASVNDIQGNYTIGSHISVALYSLSGFLPELLYKYPNLNIKLRHDLSRKISEGVISSAIDIGIVVNPVRHPDLVIIKLCDDEVTLWSNGEKRIIQEIHSDNAVLICDPDLLQSQSLLKQIKKFGIGTRRIIESSSLEIVTDLTASGCGVGILPSRVASLAKGKKLKKILNAPMYHDEICLIFRVENKNVKSIQIISEAVKKYFS